MITTADFQTSIAVNSTVADSFEAICRVSDWWTTDIEGSTRGVGSRFTVRFADTSVDFQVTEFAQNSAISWLVTDCYLPWLEDQNEWTGTTMRFEIATTDNRAHVMATHLGLVPALECFEGCSQGWKHHIGDSLRALIEEGAGMPRGRQLHVSVTVPSSAAEAFESICRVSEWWSPEFEGSSKSVGDCFTVRFGDRHMSKCQIVEISLGQRIVWEVTDSCLQWLDNKTEWTGTQIIWVIQNREDSVLLTMTHKGIEPTSECFTACRNGWEYFVSSSLARLITEGKGQPGLPQSTGKSNE